MGVLEMTLGVGVPLETLAVLDTLMEDDGGDDEFPTQSKIFVSRQQMKRIN